MVRLKLSLTLSSRIFSSLNIHHYKHTKTSIKHPPITRLKSSKVPSLNQIFVVLYPLPPYFLEAHFFNAIIH